MSKLLNWLIWGIVALLAVVWLLSFSSLVLILGAIGLSGIIGLYLFLVCGAFLEEGTGRLALKFGAYDKTLVARTGFVIDSDGTIREKKEDEEEERHFLGGWRWVGFWPFFKVFVKDKFSWAKIKPDGTIEEKEEKNVSEFLVRYYVYGLKCENAEDNNLVPTNSFWSVTAWTSNLKKAWLDTEDWFGAFKNRVLPYIRHHITLHTYEDIIAKDKIRLDKEVRDTLRDEKIFKELEDRHGIKIIAMECVDFSPDEMYRKDTTKKWQAQREAERRREERVGSTSGALIAMIADQLGVSIKEIQDEFKEDPDDALERYERLIEMNKDFIEQQLAADAGSLRRYYFSGGTGGMDIIALLGDVFRGASGVKPGAQESKPAKGKKGTRKTEEDEEEEEEEEDTAFKEAKASWEKETGTTLP